MKESYKLQQKTCLQHANINGKYINIHRFKSVCVCVIKIVKFSKHELKFI